MGRFGNRHNVAIAPAPGTILPGVPFVGRDAGSLIPAQRVHDPLSSADRKALLLAAAAHRESLEELDTSGHDSTSEAVADVGPGDVLLAENDTLEASVTLTAIADHDDSDTDHVLEGEPLLEAQSAVEGEPLIEADPALDPSEAIDDELLAAVVRRRPAATPATRLAPSRRPAPERLKLMVGVLARDFERFGTSRVPVPAVPAQDVATDPAQDWGPWPAPHTPAWPVIVPPWGALPRSFAAMPTEAVTRLA